MSVFSDVVRILSDEGLLMDKNSFEWVAERKNYKFNVKAGRYFINRVMNNNELVNMLRSGMQVPLRISFHNLRTKQQLAGKIAKQLETDSLSIIQLINDSTFLDTNGLTKENVSSIFIPNTYEFYWNTSAEEFVNRMLKEYSNFWNSSRKAKAENKNLNYFEDRLSIGSGKKIGRIGIKTFIYYLCTSLFAIINGLLLSNLFKPGIGANIIQNM